MTINKRKGLRFVLDMAANMDNSLQMTVKKNGLLE
jgi:hypothetical protein